VTTFVSSTQLFFPGREYKAAEVLKVAFGESHRGSVADFSACCGRALNGAGSVHYAGQSSSARNLRS